MDAGDTDPRSGPLRVVSAARRTFGGFSDLAFDPRLRLFLADLVRPFGLPLRDDLLDNGAGHSYGEMAAEVIREAVPVDSPVDLLVMAFGIHDIWLGRATASYLSEVCPGDAMGFAVCDQGAAAAFTALRLIGEYGRSGALLADDVAALSAGRADVTLVLGGGLTQFGHTYLADRVVLAPSGQPYTGPWWELAGGLAQWRDEGRLVLLAEYDQTLRYLSLSAVDFGPSPMAKPLAVSLAVPGKQWTS